MCERVRMSPRTCCERACVGDAGGPERLGGGAGYFIMPHPMLLAVSANMPTTSIRYGSKTLEKCQRRVTLVILCVSNWIHNPTERGRDEVACPQMMYIEGASAHGLGKRR